jgi:hypothetical protein
MTESCFNYEQNTWADGEKTRRWRRGDDTMAQMMVGGMMKIRVMMLALLIVGNGTLQASSQTKKYWGEGGAPCSDWTKERGAKTVLGTQMAAWIRGYVSGANVMQNQKINIFENTTNSMNAMEEWINDYCLAHPADKLVVAADLLVKTLMAQ